MLVSHSHNFIFTKPVKSAGTSVEMYFEKYCLPDENYAQTEGREVYVGKTGIVGQRRANSHKDGFYNHIPAEILRDKIGVEIWNRYFKFSIVRNPYTRLISEFNMALRRGILKTPSSSEERLAMFKHRVLMLKNSPRKLAKFRLQYLIAGKFCMNYNIRFEKLDDDLRVVCEKIGLQFDRTRLSHFKNSQPISGLSVRDHYDSECISIMTEAFKLELDTFGYELTDSPA